MFRRSIHSVRFLIVGPSPAHRRVLASTLNALGARTVREAASVDAAIDGYDIHAPDLICLDWAIPGLDGEAVLTGLWSRIGRGRRPQVLVFTDQPTLSVVERCRELGVFAVIRRPYAPRTMADKVMAALAAAARDGAIAVDARPFKDSPRAEATGARGGARA